MQKTKMGRLMVGMGGGIACLAAAGILMLGSKGQDQVQAAALFANGGAPAYALLGLIGLALATMAVGVVFIIQGRKTQ